MSLTIRLSSRANARDLREDLSLRSRQGFLAKLALSIGERLEMTRVVKRDGISAIVTQSVDGERNKGEKTEVKAGSVRAANPLA